MQTTCGIFIRGVCAQAAGTPWLPCRTAPQSSVCLPMSLGQGPTSKCPFFLRRCFRGVRPATFASHQQSGARAKPSAWPRGQRAGLIRPLPVRARRAICRRTSLARSRAQRASIAQLRRPRWTEFLRLLLAEPRTAATRFALCSRTGEIRIKSGRRLHPCPAFGITPLPGEEEVARRHGRRSQGRASVATGCCRSPSCSRQSLCHSQSGPDCG
jgi:hypothetical protein